MSQGSNLRKFFQRSLLERRLFLEAFLLLGLMRAGILLLPFRRITAMMGLVQEELCAAAGSAGGPLPELVGWAIRAAAARTPWESACLAQALTGMAMLSRRSLNATLYLGVCKDESGVEALNAHAWLRCGDTIVTGGEGYKKFAAISSFRNKFTR